MIEYSLFDN